MWDVHLEELLQREQLTENSSDSLSLYVSESHQYKTN